MTSTRFAALCCCLLAALAVVPGGAAAVPAGPAVAKCGKLAKPAKQSCLKQNAANRAAFNQIKDSKFVGTRGDGEGIESVYCANGKYESRTSGSSGTGISKGVRWQIEEAVASGSTPSSRRPAATRSPCSAAVHSGSTGSPVSVASSTRGT